MNPKIIFSGFILFTLSIFGVLSFAQVGQGPSSSPPKLPMNIPPPPSFSSIASKTGKFQIVSAEYYSQDEKAYLYKRLVSDKDRGNNEATAAEQQCSSTAVQQRERRPPHRCTSSRVLPEVKASQ